MKTVEETIELVSKLHENQTDLGGEPYINHLLWVMNDLPSEYASLEHKIMSLFHDTFEDRLPQLLVLSNGIDPYQYLIEQEYLTDYSAKGLKLLTHTPDDGFTYNEYIRNIAGSGHFGALLVKLSDNSHNSNPARLAKIIDPEKRKSYQEMANGRYARARKILLKAYNEWVF